MLFGVGIWNTLGPVKAQEFFAGYLLEQSLSVDNLFVFILVFRYFKAPKADQDKVASVYACHDCCVVEGVWHYSLCSGTEQSCNTDCPVQLHAIQHACLLLFGMHMIYALLDGCFHSAALSTHHRPLLQVLTYGIGTAAILRLVMILLGSELIESWKPVLLLFAGILLFSSYKLLVAGDAGDDNDEDLTDNGIVKLCRCLHIASILLSHACMLANELATVENI